MFLFSDFVFVAIIDGFVVGLVGVWDGAVVGGDGNDNWCDDDVFDKDDSCNSSSI